MMGQFPDWRRIERELEDIARKNGYSLDVTTGGDKVVFCNDINITEAAKELADRLGRK